MARAGTEPKKGAEDWMNIPNLISVGRFLIALLVWSSLFHTVFSEADIFILFVVGILSDKLDGFLARRLNKKTQLGQQILEPLADTALLFSAMTLVVMRYGFPLWADLYVLGLILAYVGALLANRMRNGVLFLDPPLVQKVPVLFSYFLMLFWLWRHPARFLLLYLGIVAGIWILYESWSRVFQVKKKIAT